MIITSKTNNTVKYISSLKSKKYRNKYNKYVIEGIKLVEEIINSEGKAPEFIIYSEEILKRTSLGLELLSKIENGIFKNHNVIAVTEEIFKYITEFETPQGILVVVNKQNEYTLEELETNLNQNIEEKYIILDKVQDPGNLGTIIRSAVSFGVENIICIEGSVDAFSSKVVRSTMGGIRKVNIYTISSNEIENMIDILKKHKYKIVATSLNTENYINDENIDDKYIFVMGNESNGVSKEILDKCNRLVKIPMENTMESLNVGAATTIIMYEQYIRGKR